MKTREELLNTIWFRIFQAYTEPQMMVSDIGELDVALSQLHWLYAFGTDNMEQFAAARLRQDRDSFERLQTILGSHKPITCPGDAMDVIDEWKRIDNEMKWSTS